MFDFSICLLSIFVSGTLLSATGTSKFVPESPPAIVYSVETSVQSDLLTASVNNCFNETDRQLATSEALQQQSPSLLSSRKSIIADLKARLSSFHSTSEVISELDEENSAHFVSTDSSQRSPAPSSSDESCFEIVDDIDVDSIFPSSNKSVTINGAASSNFIQDIPSASSFSKCFGTPTANVPEPVDNRRFKDTDRDEMHLKLDHELESLYTSQRIEESKSASFTQQLYEECQQLLRLFGVPFLVSPSEAEAQCAFLDANGLTMGTITEDSDIWLFGGKRVFRHVFSHQRSAVESYKIQDIGSLLGLSREQLILVAMLTGCDYTDGVVGIGSVSAIEIISEWNKTNSSGEDVFCTLQRFWEWWSKCQNRQHIPVSNWTPLKTRIAKLKLKFPASFPDLRVFRAFMEPEVDSSTERFTFGRPDFDELRQFAAVKMNWSQKKTDEILLPALRKLKALSDNGFHTQITSFTLLLNKEGKTLPSKRIQLAADKLKPRTEKSPKDEAKAKKSVSKSSQETKRNAKSRRKICNDPAEEVKHDKKSSPGKSSAIGTTSLRRSSRRTAISKRTESS